MTFCVSLVPAGRATAPSPATRTAEPIDMNDLTPPTHDPQVHLSLRLLEAFRRISSESARREVLALVERLAEADADERSQAS